MELKKLMYFSRLVDLALKLDYPVSIMRENPRVAEVPFDSNRKLMSTVNGKDGKYIEYTKGDRICWKTVVVAAQVAAQNQAARAALQTRDHRASS